MDPQRQGHDIYDSNLFIYYLYKYIILHQDFKVIEETKVVRVVPAVVSVVLI